MYKVLHPTYKAISGANKPCKTKYKTYIAKQVFIHTRKYIFLFYKTIL